MTNEGSLISFAADNDKDATIYSAISANIWNTYKNTNVDSYTNLQYQIIHCQVSLLLNELDEGGNSCYYFIGRRCVYYRNRRHVIMFSG